MLTMLLSIAFGIANQLSSNLILAAKDRIKGRNNCSIRAKELTCCHKFFLRYEPHIFHDLIDSKRQLWHTLRKRLDRLEHRKTSLPIQLTKSTTYVYSSSSSICSTRTYLPIRLDMGLGFDGFSKDATGTDRNLKRMDLDTV